MAALTLMDSHGRILCKDSSCLSKTPPLMDSHGLSWQDLIYRLKLSFQNSTSHGLSWTLMDSHGRILCKDSSCLSKTPPLMASHGLSWTLMTGFYLQTQAVFPKLHLLWPLMDIGCSEQLLQNRYFEEQPT